MGFQLFMYAPLLFGLPAGRANCDFACAGGTKWRPAGGRRLVGLLASSQSSDEIWVEREQRKGTRTQWDLVSLVRAICLPCATSLLHSKLLLRPLLRFARRPVSEVTSSL